MQQSWLSIETSSDFTLRNIPFGVFKHSQLPSPRVGSRIGNFVLDLYQLAETGLMKQAEISDPEIFRATSLNDFISLGKNTTQKVRDRIIELFSEEKNRPGGYKESCMPAIYKADEVEMLLPVEIGDYTDFYSSIEHATNVGKMFRDPDNALLPNWKHIPVGYHGRSSSIIVSGTSIYRPMGQMKPDDSNFPVYGPCRLLDFELEMGYIIGQETNMGQRVGTNEAEDYIFGMVLFNDWSARDIQKWEYVPLGPFLGKNFASSMSPWVVTMEALRPFKTNGPVQDPPVLPYLEQTGMNNYDINLEVAIGNESFDPHTVSRSNFKYMYWSMAQQLAHHTVNGCNIRVGDLMASGTISGPDKGSYGSMLELSWKGSNPLPMPDGSTRKFLADGDEVIMKAWAGEGTSRVGFGEVRSIILPAIL